MSVTVDDFPAFFAAVNDKNDDGSDKDPFAWQRRLASQLVLEGRWPDRLAAPTGAGKTAAIDAHVFAVAAAFALGTRVRPPRRLAMVVDRRALVDDQYERALALAQLLRDAVGGTGIVARIADCLVEMQSRSPVQGVEPLMVARLRGGEPPSRIWRDDPCACTVICATPDMWGSRLLLRGYGSRRAARPVEAGLLAFDCAVVVDEAHLSRQLLSTARRVAELQARAPSPVGPMPLQPVETTATPSPGAGTEIGVLEEDLETDHELARRLRASKDLRLVTGETWPLPDRGPARRSEIEAFAQVAMGLREELGPTIGCFVNTVRAASDLAAELRRSKLEVELVCGRMRGIDLVRLRKRRPGLLSLKGDPSVDVLVTTQSLEVGVDLDLAGAISELAPATALAQRAGRVNRIGNRRTAAVCVVVPDGPIDDDERSGPYGAPALNVARSWLEGRAADRGGLAPWAVRADPPPSPETRILHRVEQWDAWHLARTSSVLGAEPDVEVWLSDDLELDLDVAIVVRSGLTGDPDVDIPYLSACATHAAEAFPVPVSRARALLDRLPSDQPAYIEVEGGFVLASRDPARADAPGPRLRPSAVVVVSDAAPLLRDGIVHEEPKDSAHDVAEEAAMHEERRDLRIGLKMPLAHVSDHAELTDALDLIGDLDVDTRPGRDAVARVVRHLATEARDPDWRDHVDAVGRALTDAPLVRMEVKVFREPDGSVWLVNVRDGRRRIADEQLQLLTSARNPVTLDDHQAAVGTRAGMIASMVGLSSRLAQLEGLAGRHHDDGKADPRFQVALNADEVPLAKSGMTSRTQARVAFSRSGLPTGWRHEQRSAVAAWQALGDLPPEERALVVRLVGCSHGSGRPDFAHSSCELLAHGSTLHASSGELLEDGAWDELLEWTDQQFGVWGSAYLESILRAADVQISGEGR